MWGSILTIVVYTEQMWGWSMVEHHPKLYKFVKGCYNRTLKWLSSSSNSSDQDDVVDLPKSFHKVLRGISTILDFLLQSSNLQVIDLDNLVTETYLAEKVPHVNRVNRMMVACSQLYIYVQAAQGNESENGTENHNVMAQRLDELIREECVVEITDGPTKEAVVKNSHFILGQVPLMSPLPNARIWKVNTRPYNEKGKKSNKHVALALLESGILEPIDVLGKAKGMVGSSIFTRFALLAQALGFLYAFSFRWLENVSISPLEAIAAYYAVIILTRSTTHLLQITYDIRKPLLVHLDIHNMHGVSSHSPLSPQSYASMVLESLGGRRLCLLLLLVQYAIGFTFGFFSVLAYPKTACDVRQGNISRFRVVPFISFYLVFFGSAFLMCIPKLKNVLSISMMVSLLTAIVYTFYSWEDCYDQRISPSFSLPYFQ